MRDVWFGLGFHLQEHMTSSVQRCGKTGAPELPMFGFSLSALLAKVKGDFPELSSRPITVWLRIQPTLATVHLAGDEVVIELHAVLNHVHTPERVISFILRHELLHFTIPPREVDGHQSAHPPEFRKAEQNFPDYQSAWSWLTLVLGSCLRRNKKQECTFVTRQWKARMNGERPSLDYIMQIINTAAAPRVSIGKPLL